MEDNKSSQPDNLKEGLAENALQALGKKYIVIGKTHVRAWKVWLAIGLVAGLITGIAYVANRSGEFEQSEAVSQSNNEAEEPYEPGGVLVVFRKKVKEKDQIESLKKWGFENKQTVKSVPGYKLKVPEGAEDAVINALSKNPHVELAVKNGLLRASFEPNDPSFVSGEQWWINKIGLPAAWDITQGNSGILLANIDSGINKSHEDLSGIVADEICVSNGCWNSWILNIKSSAYSTEDNGNHGTQTAGVAAAITNNGIGIASAGNKIRLLNIRADDVFSTCSTGSCAYVEDVARGIIWARDQGAHIIVSGFGEIGIKCDLESYLIPYARAANTAGIPVFMGAGNQYLVSPCSNHQSLIRVAGTRADDTAGTFTYGTIVDFTAPGISIKSTNNSGTYSINSGTSFSAPISGGVAALMKTVNPGISPQRIESILKCSSVDLGPVGWDGYYGWGRIDADKAVRMAAGLISSCESRDTLPPQASVQFFPIDQYNQVSGIVEVTADVSDDSGIAEVEFYIDPPWSGSEFLASVDSVAPFTYTWDTTNVIDGTALIRIIARDNAGNVNSASRYVAVVNGISDTTSPQITIASPLDGTIISKSFTITATSTDAGLGIKQMDLYFDNQLMKTCTSSAVESMTCSVYLSFRKLANGSHIINATAVDTASNIGRATSTVSTATKSGGKGGR